MSVAMFPGQGSLSPAVGLPWKNHGARAVLDQISEVANRDVWELLTIVEGDELVRTDNAQLATFAMSAMVGQAARDAGLDATAAIGHSLGEYSALHFAGILSLEDATRLVCARGTAMLRASVARPGTMAAILGADRSTIEAAIRSCDDVVIANVNAPGQIVVAGPVDQIEALRRDARDLGLRKVLVLAVGGAFHSPLMAPALQDLDDALASAEFLEGRCPVVANVDGRLHAGGHVWRGLLSRQLTEPVLFADSVTGIGDAHQVFVELGPGGVLAGLVTRITETAATLSIVQPSDLKGLEDLSV